MSKFKLSKGVILAITLVGIVSIGIIFFSKTDHKVRKYLKEDSNFRYKTSITSNYSSKNKADIFETKMSPYEAKDYIDRIFKNEIYSETIEESNIYALSYDLEDVLIYKGDDEVTYVQVSDDEYVRNNGYGSVYRKGSLSPSSKILLLDLAQRRKRSSSRGFFGGGSARSSSSGSRTSVGGGTSFGK